MNKHKILLLTFFLAITTFFGKAQNLITNGDFVANATGWNTTGTISYLTHNTTGNVMVLNNADAAGTYYVYQWVPATPGAVYSLNGVAATHAVTGTASIKMQFYAANQTTLLGTSSTNNITVSFNTSSWTAFPTLTYTAPANTAYIKVLGTSVNRALKWDNLVLTTPCSANITGLIFNDMVGSNDMTLTNGATYYLSSLPSSFNIEAVYTGNLESMRYTLSGGASSTIIENTDPYNFPGTGTAWSYGTGTYTLLAEAFSADNAGGTLCASQTFNFTIGTCNNLTSGGTIGNNETLCGTSVDPSLIVNLTSPSGGSSSPIEYLWLISLDGGTTNTVISGATNSTYDPGVITQTTWYRRCARRQGCTDYDGESNWIQKTVCPPPTANAGSNQTKNCTTTSVTIGSSSVSGTTYAWSPTTGLSSSTISNPIATPSTTTTYTVTATNACGCTATSSVTVTVNTTPPTAIAGTNQSLTCAITSVSIGTSSVAGYTYSWSPTTGLSSSTISNPTASPALNTTYTVTVTSANGCTATSSVTINNTCITTNQVCYIGTNNPTAVSATSTYTINPGAGTLTIRTTFAKTFVDNTYGTNAIGWPANNHTFNHLVGSDKLQLALYDANNVKKLEFVMDYLTASSAVSSGYKSLGVSGGDGSMVFGTASNVLNVTTSLDQNFNTFGYVLTTNSPATNTSYAPNATYPNWIYEVWYEATVNLSVFGAAGFGSPSIVSVHASPSKTGNNTEPVTPGNCCSNVTSGGTIGSDEIVCGLSFDPALITNITLPSGGNSNQLEYVWLISTDAGANYTLISGATGSTYDPGVITQTTWYRRCARRQGCPSYDGESNWIKKELKTPPTANAGPDYTICLAASQTIGTAAITGNTYLWTPATGLSSATIAQPLATPSATSTYTVTVTGSNGCTASDAVVITVNICTVNITGNVFEDNNGPTNVDGTGIGNPSGLPLYANLMSATGTIIATTTVNANGTFTFLNVTPNANYTINISATQGIIGNPAPSPSLPSGWSNVSEDCCDNTGNDGTTNGNVFVAVSTSNVSNVNFGIRQALSLGNTIWVDVNRNGIKEASETGLENASVKLYADANSDGIPDGAALQITTSNASGEYVFEGLNPGNYMVGVIPPTGNVYTSSVSGEETNPNNNIDNNDNGIVTLSGETQSGTITLTAGQEPTGESGSLVNVPDANANLTLDFGFFVCPTSFIFPDAYVCNGNVVNLTAFEPLHYSGGTWMQGTTTLTSTLVGPGTYTYNFSNGTCISSGNITIAENIPDYTPSISIAPNAITGITNMRIILTITELLNRTPCSDVYVFVPRLEPRFTMAYEPTATVVGGVPVNNNDWQYFNTNPNFYVWKFTGASAFPGGSESKIGFLGNYDPSQTDGETSFNVQIFQGSGGELNITNNTDSEILLYFR